MCVYESAQSVSTCIINIDSYNLCGPENPNRTISVMDDDEDN